MCNSLAVVNLTQIRKNVKTVKGRLKPKVKYCAVVKSNAYGHGIVQVSSNIENLVDFFAVSFLQEGIKLRLSGILKPILILIPLQNHELEIAQRYNLSVCLNGLKQSKYILNKKLRLNVHIAVNSGMNRLGIDRIWQLNQIIKNLKNSFSTVEGIFSHFYSTEYKNCLMQYKKFLPFSIIAKKHFPKIISHISASGGVNFKKFNMDMVRVGILNYGYTPSSNFNIKVTPCLKIYAQKLIDRKLNKKENLLYGNYNLQTSANISIIKYGYADGASRNQNVDYNNMCMDLSAVKKSGKYCLVLNNAQKIAEKINTISYDVLVKYTSRCRYKYEDNCR